MKRDIDNQLLTTLQSCTSQGQKAKVILDNFIKAGLDIGTPVWVLSLSDITVAMAKELTDEQISMLHPVDVMATVRDKLGIPWEGYVELAIKLNLLE